MQSLESVTDLQLCRLVSAANLAVEDERADIADLLADIISYVPDSRTRLLKLLELRALPSPDRETAIQILELWNGEFLHEIRQQYKPTR